MTSSNNGEITNAAAAAPTTSDRIGPHPGHITTSNQYTSEAHIRQRLTSISFDSARENSYRLQGVQLIDQVRESLQLPVRTYDTACVYYHKLRLSLKDSEVNYLDAALASLFVACKVEDTIKKSREILAAGFVIRYPEKPPLTADDRAFDTPSRVIMGVERLILETIGFDFRTRYPQKLLAKVIRALYTSPFLAPAADASSNAATTALTSPQQYFHLAYSMSIDMYKTLIPIKHTTFTMVAAIAELTALLLRDKPLAAAAHGFAQSKLPDSQQRRAVVESMLDILDLYIHNQKSTRAGQLYEMQNLIDTKISLNNILQPLSSSSSSPASGSPSHSSHPPPGPLVTTITTPKAQQQQEQPSSSSSELHPTSPKDCSSSSSSNNNNPLRYIFDLDAARQEQETVAGFFANDYEEYEVEVEEPVTPPPPSAPRRDDNRRYHGGGGGSHRRERRGGGGGYRGGDRGHRGRGRNY